MKKLVLISAIAAALPTATLAAPFVAKNVGQGFTGVTGDFTSALYNPSLLAKFETDDDFYLSLGAGIMASDQDDLIDGIDDTQALLEALEDKVDNGSATEEDGEALIDSLEDLDGKVVSVDAGLNLMIALPMDWASLALFVNQEVRLGTHFNYDGADETIIIEGILNDDLDGDDLMSGATVLGYSVTEAGLILAKTYKSSSFDVHYGTNLKYQRVDLFNYTDTISSFDSDNFDAEEYLADDSQFNLDLGVQIAWGAQRQWQAGLAAKNLMGFDLDSAPLLDDGGNELPDSSYSFSLDPVVTAGLSYDNGTFRLAAEADLTSHGEFASLDEVQYAKVGLELDAWEWAQLRLGYRTDMKSNATDVATVGLGLSPFDVVALDLAAIAGSDNTYGGVIQLGVKF